MNRRHLRLVLALLLAGSPSFAQEPPKPEAKPEAKPQSEQKPEPQPPPKPESPHPQIHVPLGQDPNDPHQQMLKLFGEVGTRLREIDKLLAEAAAGRRGAQDARKPLEKAVAGIDELVKRSQDEGHKVVEAIDKILELAQQEEQQGQGNGSGKQGGKGGAQGNQQSTQQGKSPLDGARDTTTQRESTPDKPGSESGQQKQGEKPDPSGNPRGNKKTSGDPQNTAGKPPPGQETEKVAHGPDARESWGWLPEHARDVFRTQGGGAMPARYREWIDAYYKKLNQKP
jgi:hypothetical protein